MSDMIKSPHAPGQVAAAAARWLPGCQVRTVDYRGLRIRHIYRIELEDGRTVWLKTAPAGEWSDPSEKEAYVAGLMQARHIPAPATLALDMSGDILPQPFIIQEHAGGRSLAAWMEVLRSEELPALYQVLGRFFRRIHTVRGERSGWIYGSGRVLERHPNDFMHEAVFVEQGKRLVQAGLIPAGLYERLVTLSEAILPEMKQHTPTLVCSTLPWTIYLDITASGWTVTKLTDLHDALYWDPLHNLAGIRYPAFAVCDPECWQAFLEGYGETDQPVLDEPGSGGADRNSKFGRTEGNRNCPMSDTRFEEKLAYYRLMSCIDAVMGNYMEPRSDSNEAWKRQALSELESLIRAISESLA